MSRLQQRRAFKNKRNRKKNVKEQMERGTKAWEMWKALFHASIARLDAIAVSNDVVVFVRIISSALD